MKRDGLKRRLPETKLIYLLFFAAVLFLAWQTPYCHDEWKWGLPARIELMKRGFENYNGRYLGNLLALLITRSTFWKTAVPTGFMVWLLVLLYNGIAGKQDDGPQRRGKSLFLLLCSIFLLASLPRTLYAQSYGWMAAFVNFVPPVVLFLVYFNWTQDVYGTGESKAVRWWAASVPLGIATQLFSEHVTILVLLYAVWIAVLARVRKGKFYALHLCYLASAAVGAVIMFSNGAYRRAAENPNLYKKISFSVAEMYYQIRDKIIDPLFVDNYLLNAVLAGVLLVLIIRRGRKTLIDAANVIILSGFALYCTWHRLYPYWTFTQDAGLNNTIELILCALFFCSVVLSIWRTLKTGDALCVLALYVSAAASAVPLLAANPIGPRCFYFSYVLMCLAVLKLTDQILKESEVSLWYPTLLAAVLVTVLCIIYLRMFARIGETDRSRMEMIQTAIAQEAEQAVLPYLPYSDYCWTTVPVNEEWLSYFNINKQEFPCPLQAVG